LDFWFANIPSVNPDIKAFKKASFLLSPSQSNRTSAVSLKRKKNDFFAHFFSGEKTGMPDFLVHRTKNGGKCTQGPQNVPTGRRTYQMAVDYSKWP
jgi:hypothetical protein